METINIKGKEYITVNERLKHFWKFYELHSIFTEIVELKDNFVLMKASIIDENGDIKATGHAYELAGSSFINKTSYIENCETSAIGRALGIFGVGIDTSVASADEVNNAINQQEKEKEKDKAHDQLVKLLLPRYGDKKLMNVVNAFAKNLDMTSRSTLFEYSQDEKEKIYNYALINESVQKLLDDTQPSLSERSKFLEDIMTDSGIMDRKYHQLDASELKLVEAKLIEFKKNVLGG